MAVTISLRHDNPFRELHRVFYLFINFFFEREVKIGGKREREFWKSRRKIFSIYTCVQILGYIRATRRYIPVKLQHFIIKLPPRPWI